MVFKIFRYEFLKLTYFKFWLCYAFDYATISNTKNKCMWLFFPPKMFGSFQIIFYISKLINIYFLRKNKKILFDLKKQKLFLKLVYILLAYVTIFNSKYQKSKNFKDFLINNKDQHRETIHKKLKEVMLLSPHKNLFSIVLLFFIIFLNFNFILLHLVCWG